MSRLRSSLVATGLLLNIVVSSLSAKELWLDAGYRDLSYPKEEFYTASIGSQMNRTMCRIALTRQS